MTSLKIWRVYRHITPDKMIYVGVTSQKLYNRWNPSQYKTTSLWPYIEQYGWSKIQHEVIYTCDDRNEALEIEDEMIQYWNKKGCCLNKKRSGLIEVSDKKGYINSYYKAFRLTPEGKIYNRVSAFNQYHPDSVTITHAEARHNYITYGIVPSFIKHDDIPNAIIYNPSVSTDQLPLFNESTTQIEPVFEANLPNFSEITYQTPLF